MNKACTSPYTWTCSGYGRASTCSRKLQELRANLDAQDVLISSHKIWCAETAGASQHAAPELVRRVECGTFLIGQSRSTNQRSGMIIEVQIQNNICVFIVLKAKTEK